jgi:hypothetical protein
VFGADEASIIVWGVAVRVVRRLAKRGQPAGGTPLFQFVRRDVREDKEPVRPADPHRAFGEFHSSGEFFDAGVRRDTFGKRRGIIGRDFGGIEDHGNEDEEQRMFHG